MTYSLFSASSKLTANNVCTVCRIDNAEQLQQLVTNVLVFVRAEPEIARLVRKEAAELEQQDFQMDLDQFMDWFHRAELGLGQQDEQADENASSVLQGYIPDPDTDTSIAVADVQLDDLGLTNQAFKNCSSTDTNAKYHVMKRGKKKSKEPNYMQCCCAVIGVMGIVLFLIGFLTWIVNGQPNAGTTELNPRNDFQDEKCLITLVEQINVKICEGSHCATVDGGAVSPCDTFTKYEFTTWSSTMNDWRSNSTYQDYSYLGRKVCHGALEVPKKQPDLTNAKYTAGQIVSCWQSTRSPVSHFYRCDCRGEHCKAVQGVCMKVIDPASELQHAKDNRAWAGTVFSTLFFMGLGCLLCCLGWHMWVHCAKWCGVRPRNEPHPL